MTKRKIIITVTDQADIDAMQKEISRQYCGQIYFTEVEIPVKNPQSYPFQTEEYPDDEEG